MDARPSHADAKPSASYRDKSGICNLCRQNRNYKTGGGTHSRASAGRSGRPPPGHNGRGPAFKGKRPQTDCSIGHAVLGVLPEVAGRTSFIHSTGMVRSYSWLRYTVTTSISLKS